MKKGKDAAEERQLVGDAAQLQAEERMEERQAATVSKSSASAVPSTEGSQGFRKKEQREKKSQPPTPQSPEQEKAEARVKELLSMLEIKDDLCASIAAKNKELREKIKAWADEFETLAKTIECSTKWLCNYDNQICENDISRNTILGIIDKMREAVK